MEDFIVNGEDRVVQEPGLHDSVLIGVAIETNSVQLRFRTPTRKIVRVLLDGVLGFSLESMWEQNIVFEMRITPATGAAPQDVRRALHQSSDIGVGGIRSSKLKSDDFVIVEIDATLGADVRALCREAKWQFDQ